MTAGTGQECVGEQELPTGDEFRCDGALGWQEEDVAGEEREDQQIDGPDAVRGEVAGRDEHDDPGPQRVGYDHHAFEVPAIHPGADERREQQHGQQLSDAHQPEQEG
jgi:hypothetical protein